MSSRYDELAAQMEQLELVINSSSTKTGDAGTEDQSDRDSEGDSKMTGTHNTDVTNKRIKGSSQGGQSGVNDSTHRQEQYFKHKARKSRDTGQVTALSESAVSASSFHGIDSGYTVPEGRKMKAKTTLADENPDHGNIGPTSDDLERYIDPGTDVLSGMERPRVILKPKKRRARESR